MIETIIISIVGLIVSIIVGVNAMLNNKRTHQREEDRRKDEKEQKDRARQKNRPQFKLVSVKKNLNEFEYFKEHKDILKRLGLVTKNMTMNTDKLHMLNKKLKKFDELRQRLLQKYRTKQENFERSI